MLPLPDTKNGTRDAVFMPAGSTLQLELVDWTVPIHGGNDRLLTMMRFPMPLTNGLTIGAGQV